MPTVYVRLTGRGVSWQPPPGNVWSLDTNFKKNLKSWPHAERKAADTQLLTTLYLWRDGVAREEDENAHFICPTRLLMEFAKSRPDSEEAVQAKCRQMGASPIAYASQISELIAADAMERATAPSVVPAEPQVDLQGK
jgi:ribonuclease D